MRFWVRQVSCYTVSSGGGGGYIKQLGLNPPITVPNTVSCQLTLRITRTEQEGVTGVVAVVISLSASQIHIYSIRPLLSVER